MTQQQNLIASPSDRMARKEEKEQQILRFLRDQIWSTPEILGEVANVKARQTIHKTLTRMEKQDLIARHCFETLGGKKTVWGITNQGQICAFDPNADEAPNQNYFDPSRVAETTAHHHIGIQRIRLAAEKNGWSNWVDGNTLKASNKDGKRPDALFTSPGGSRFAIEFERSFKTIKRYEVILSIYLQALKQRDVDSVIWICPDLKFKRRLETIILGIKRVNVRSQSVLIDPERHHINLHFIPIDQWPVEIIKGQ